MPFALTHYIFPFKEPICLSQKLNYWLDNPRSESEIALVQETLDLAIDKYNSDPHLLNIGHRLSYSLSDFVSHMKAANGEDYAVNYFDQRETSSLLLILKSWVIIRFNDTGEFEGHLKDKSSFWTIVLNKTANGYTQAFDSVQNYSYLISLLCHDYELDYEGNSFVISKSFLSLFQSSDIDQYNVSRAIECFIGEMSLIKEVGRGKDWKFWVDGNSDLLQTAKILENTFTVDGNLDKNKPKKPVQSPIEKMMFVGSLLKTIHRDVQDLKIKLLLLVSIIEYVLTRNPDANRFNVEDSISKQFKLKAAILIHVAGSEETLEEIKARLTKIYNQRSDIAHGNYHADHKREDYLESVLVLYKYIRAIIKMYTIDKELVEYLKNS